MALIGKRYNAGSYRGGNLQNSQIHSSESHRTLSSPTIAYITTKTGLLFMRTFSEQSHPKLRKQAKTFLVKERTKIETRESVRSCAKSIGMRPKRPPSV